MNAKQKAKISKVQKEITELKSTINEMYTHAQMVEQHTINVLNHLRDLDKELENLKG